MSLFDSLQSLTSMGGGSVSGLGGASSLTGGQDIKQMLSGLDLNKLQQTADGEVKSLGTSFTTATDGLKSLLGDTTGTEKAGRSIFAETGSLGGSSSGQDSFASMLGGLVDSVDSKFKASEQAAGDIMLGKSDNIHQAMISMQEASISFDLLVQVRNKLVDSYKELSRMSV